MGFEVDPVVDPRTSPESNHIPEAVCYFPTISRRCLEELCAAKQAESELGHLHYFLCILRQLHEMVENALLNSTVYKNSITTLDPRWSHLLILHCSH